jgi:hypothetical protein
MGYVKRMAGMMVMAAALAAAGGCGSDRDPNQPPQRLTTDEGDALLREIRSDRGRMQKLTPAEREYLARTLGR